MGHFTKPALGALTTNWEKPTESHLLSNSFGGMRCLCTLSTSPQTPASKPASWITWVPPPESRCLPQASLNWINTESRVLYAHVLRRPRCSPCIPWLFFCRSCCLYIAFLTRAATLRTMLKSMQFCKARLYDAFSPCRSFLKHRSHLKAHFVLYFRCILF